MIGSLSKTVILELSEEKNYLCFYIKKIFGDIATKLGLAFPQREEIFLLLNNFNSCKKAMIVFDLSVKLVLVVNKT